MHIATAAVSPSCSRSTNLKPSLNNISTLRWSVTAQFKFPTRNVAFQNRIFSIYATSSSIATENSSKFPQVSSFDRREESRILQFVKYHGLGNDFILVDNRSSSEPKVTPEEAVKLCDRNFGVGADGVIFVMPGVDGTDYTMRIFNSDGSEPEMCGNGVRCFARFIAELENLHGRHSFTIHTGAGLIVPQILEDGKTDAPISIDKLLESFIKVETFSEGKEIETGLKVRVDMGEPILEAANVPTNLPANKGKSVVKADLDVDGTIWNVTCVSMGNPHCVTFGIKGGSGLQVDELNLAEIGPKFEHHNAFPARTNTEFVQVLSPTRLKMRVWERGAGATLACGTGACALVVAAVLEGRASRQCTVDLPGGPLEIEWREEDNHIYMTGPAEVAFYGSALL